MCQRLGFVMVEPVEVRIELSDTECNFGSTSAAAMTHELCHRSTFAKLTFATERVEFRSRTSDSSSNSDEDSHRASFLRSATSNTTIQTKLMGVAGCHPDAFLLTVFLFAFLLVLTKMRNVFKKPSRKQEIGLPIFRALIIATSQSETARSSRATGPLCYVLHSSTCRNGLSAHEPTG